MKECPAFWLYIHVCVWCVAYLHYLFVCIFMSRCAFEMAQLAFGIFNIYCIFRSSTMLCVEAHENIFICFSCRFTFLYCVSCVLCAASWFYCIISIFECLILTADTPVRSWVLVLHVGMTRVDIYDRDDQYTILWGFILRRGWCFFICGADSECVFFTGAGAS